MNGELILTGDTYDVGRIAINNAFSGTGYFNNIEAAGTITGATYYSGSTLLSTIIQSFVSGVATQVQPGTNILTGGTSLLPTISTVGSPKFTNNSVSGLSQLNSVTAVSLTGGTVSGGTIYSGNTNLYNIFQQLGVGFVPLTGTNGVNIVTGDIEFDSNLGIFWNAGNDTITWNAGNGALEVNASSVFDITSGVLASGGTDLYNIFATSVTGGFQGWTSSTGSNSIIANNSTSNLASGNYAMAGGSGTTASGITSQTGGIAANANNYAEWARSSGTLGQYGFLTYFVQLTGNVSTEAFLNGGSGTQRFVIPRDTAYYVKLSAVGRITGGLSDGDAAQFYGTGVIKNVAGTVSFVGVGGFAMNSTFQDATFAGVVFDVLADNTNKSLQVKITSIDAETVNWFVLAEYVKAN